MRLRACGAAAIAEGMSTASGRARTARSTQNLSLWRTAGRVALVLVAIPLILVPLYGTLPSITPLMLWSRLKGPVERDWVSLDEISPTLVAAVVMSEDGRFCTHHGVDWTEMGKVLDDSDGPSRGASTITMQAVKNLFLWPLPSYVRKPFEIALAFYADVVWSKRRTMTIYLNIVEWGHGVFGAEAAAQHYFKRSARQLSLRQAALLAATLPNPLARDPARPSRALQAAASRVSGRAQQAGDYIRCIYP
jgi:monofunctional biosynthetic peptidoglycan transglycosylase